MFRFPSIPLCLAALLALPTGAETLVSATTKPGKTWRQFPTTLLADLPATPVENAVDPFGGSPSAGTRASGFFRTEKIDGRWWFVTPDGGLMTSRGINSVSLSGTTRARKAVAKEFGDTEAWAAGTLKMLRENGFNTLGGWSDVATLASARSPMPHTVMGRFMSGYGKVRGGTYQKPGHTGYPGDCPFIFDPEFAAFCETQARQLASEKNDSWIIGRFSDNEMPWSRKMLENYLALPSDDPGHDAAASWLAARREVSGKSDAAINDDDRAAFLAFAVDRYASTVAAALRKHAPNHLFLGPRLHGAALRLPEVFEALGRHVDVVSVNYYNAWDPDPELLEMWNRQSGRPILITEFYAKGDDSGMPNHSGAGWLVKTQKDRGAFYQNFTLGLVRSRVCIGWHWHRYADNDPDDKRLDPSNRDSNKGVVDNRYEPFPDLLDAMRAVNLRTTSLAASFDAGLDPDHH